MLESAGLNSEQIALRCGFASVESFRVAFRNVVGLAPSYYREGFGHRQMLTSGQVKNSAVVPL